MIFVLPEIINKLGINGRVHDPIRGVKDLKAFIVDVLVFFFLAELIQREFTLFFHKFQGLFPFYFFEPQIRIGGLRFK